MARFGFCCHCKTPLDSPDFHSCGSCAILLREMGESLDREAGSDDRPAVRETEEARRERFHAARVAHVRAEHTRGFRCLLARALNADDQSDWSRPQPR